MDDEIAPRLPPRYSSLPRRSQQLFRALDRQNGNHSSLYDSSQPGPSTLSSKPQPFARDYQQQSSTRSAAPSRQSSRRKPPQTSNHTMGNGQSTAHVIRDDEWTRVPRPNGWMPIAPSSTVVNNHHDKGRQLPSTSRRTELELASEHPLLPNGPLVPQQRAEKKRKSIRKRIGSFLSFTIRSVVNVLNGTSEAERRSKVAEQFDSPPKRTQSLTRLDSRWAEEREESHRRTQSVRAPRRREEEAEMPRRAAAPPPNQMALRRSTRSSVNGLQGIMNLGNTCNQAAAVQALRCLFDRIKTEAWVLMKTENSDDTLEIVMNVYNALDHGTPEDVNRAFEAFVTRVCQLRNVDAFTEQDDASLVLASVLDILHTQTRIPLVPPTEEEMEGFSELDRYLAINRAEENSPFYELVRSTIQTYTICFECGNSSKAFHNEVMVPCVIPGDLNKIEATYPPQRVNFVRYNGDRCMNVRAHIPRYPTNVKPFLCELKSQVMDHDLIELFDLDRTEMFLFGSDGWDRLGQRDSIRDRGCLNENLAVVEFPEAAELVVLVTYGGDTRDFGPLIFKMRRSSTVQDLREKMREYLRAFHPFTPDIFMRKELLPKEDGFQTEICLNPSSSFASITMVWQSINKIKLLYPHLPNFIRVTAKYDVSAVPVDESCDAVALHRSAMEDRKRIGHHKFIKVDITYILNCYFHAGSVMSWRCSNGHADRAGQITSFVQIAQYIFIQIRRAQKERNSDAYKIDELAFVPTLINLGPYVCRGYPPVVDHFEMPRRQRDRVIYELCSVISHAGDRTDVGHYVTFIYHPDTKTFTKMNDFTVRQAYHEMINDPFVVIYRHKPEGSLAEINYNIVKKAPDYETVFRTAEMKAEEADRNTEGEIEMPDINPPYRLRRSVRFDKSKEPRYYPDREPADLKGSKRKKKSKK